MENLEIYNKVKSVPENAKREIQAGRLKGMTDINPQFRIEKLTEIFGPVGIGWYTEEVKREFVNGANDEVVCFVDIKLYIKDQVTNDWSKPIVGTGGSTFVANQNKGLYTSDEVVKMAYTDALSVACKQLGIGADVYWNKNDSKYNKNNTNNTNSKSNTSNKNNTTSNKPAQPKKEMVEDGQIKAIQILFNQINQEGLKEEMYQKVGVKSSKELTKKQATSLIKALKRMSGETDENN